MHVKTIGSIDHIILMLAHCPMPTAFVWVSNRLEDYLVANMQSIFRLVSILKTC